MRIRMLISTCIAVILAVGIFYLFVDDSAAEQYEEILERAYTYVTLGTVNRRNNMWLEDGVDMFIYASQAEPDSVEAHLAAGMGLEVQGDIERAMHHYQIVRELAPSFPVDALIGDAWLRQGDLQRAEEAFLQAYNQNKDNVLVLEGMARITEITGRHDEAKSYREHIVAERPEDINAFIEYSKMLLRFGEAQNAYDVLHRLDEERRGGERYYAQLGLTLAALNETEEACVQLQTARRLGSNDAMVMETLERLECNVR